MGKISDTIQKKRTALKSVIDEPFSEVFWYENEYKKKKAQAYLNELDEIELVTHVHPIEVCAVKKETLEEESQKADHVSVEFAGKFCKIVLIQNYQKEPKLLLYMESIDLLETH